MRARGTRFEFFSKECEKLIAQLDEVTNQKIDEFEEKARLTRIELERTLMSGGAK